MKTKKKLLIALLSAACVTAGAFGLAACGGEEADPNAGLQAAYATYQKAAGNDALSYDAWLALIKTGNLGNSDTPVIPPVDDVDELKEAYETYVKAAGDNALSYNEWVALITSEMKDPLETAYEAYKSATAAANGLALDYDDWKATIMVYNEPTENKVIVSTHVDNQGNFILKFSDDTEKAVGKVSGDFTVEINGETVKVTAPQLFMVKAVDQNGDPVKDAYLSLGIKTGAYSFEDLSIIAKTDGYGYASFSIIPQTGATYAVRTVRDYSLTENNPPVPAGYEVNLGQDQYGFDIMDKAFESGSYEMEFTFRNVINKFPFSATQKFYYSREYVEFDDNGNSVTPYIKEDRTDENDVLHENLELTLRKGVYSYFTFSPYVSPTTVNTKDINPNTGKNYTSDEVLTEVQRRLDNAEDAAKGTYKVTFTANSSNVTLYNFAGSLGYIVLDEDGIPSIINNIAGKLPEGADESLYTGSNSITLNLNSASVRGDNIFAIVATDNCNVTVSIERIGDAVEPPENVIEEVQVTGSPKQYANNTSSEVLTLMPISTTWKVVYNEQDGYYHVNSANGPVLLVNINKNISRVNNEGFTLATLPTPEGNPLVEAIYYFSYKYDENGYPTNSYDFNKLISTYSALCNSDGVYPVNQDLKLFLDFYGNKCMSAAGPDSELAKLNWLIPCQYYAPANGFPVDGAGTAANPFILNECLNAVTVSSSASLSFTAPSAGVYAFEYSAGTLTANGSVESTAKDNILYVSLQERQTVELNWTGASGANTVNVSGLEILSPVYDIQYIEDDNTQTSTEVDNSQGISEKTAIRLTTATTTAFEINTEVCEEGLYICYQVKGNGYIYFDLGDSDVAQIIYDGKVYTGNQLVLTVEAGTYNLLLTAKDANGNVVDGIFFLQTTLVAR